MITIRGINVKTGPEVYVISRPSFDFAEMIRFLHDNDFSTNKLWASEGTDGEKLVEMATRLCYLSFEKGRSSEDFHKNILEQHHGSTIEHANWTLLIAGVSRSWSHEMVRHRAGFAFSQLSQRYVDEGQCVFVMPPAVQELDDIDQDLWVGTMVMALDGYKHLITVLSRQMDKQGLDKTTRRKRAREAARSALPNATETMITITGNARAWRHFIEMRSEAFADAEMRRVAVAVYRKMVEEAPFLFGDYEEVHILEEGDGEITKNVPVIHTENKKV